MCEHVNQYTECSALYMLVLCWVEWRENTHLNMESWLFAKSFPFLIAAENEDEMVYPRRSAGGTTRKDLSTWVPELICLFSWYLLKDLKVNAIGYQ